MRDLDSHYSLMDVVDHNDALDLKAAAKHEAHEKAMEKMNNG